MFIAKTFSKIKAVLIFAALAMTMVRVVVDWIFVIKEGITAVKEARARRKK